MRKLTNAVAFALQLAALWAYLAIGWFAYVIVSPAPQATFTHFDLRPTLTSAD